MFKEIIFFLKLIEISKVIKFKIITIFTFSLIIPILEILILSVFLINLNFIISDSPETSIFKKIFEILNLNTNTDNFYIYFTLGSIALVCCAFLINIIYEFFLLKFGADFFSEVKKKTMNLFVIQKMETYIENSPSKQIQIVSNELNSTYLSYIGCNNIIKTLSMFIFFSIFLLVQDFSVSSKAIGIIILFNFVIFSITKKKFQKYGIQDFSLSVNQTTYNSEVIKNLYSIKQFLLENYIIKIAKKNYDNFAMVRFKNIFLTKIVKLFIEFVIYVSSLLLIYYFLNNKNLLLEKIEIISAAFFAILRLAPLANSINTNFSQIIKFSTWLKPINIYLNKIVEENKTNAEGDNKDINFTGDISIQKLEISNKDKVLINSFNCDLKIGDFITIRGPVGSGKSTFIKILSKYYDEYKGTIKFNNINLKEIDNKFFFKKIKYISQDDLLFDETVDFNISLKENLKDKEKNNLTNIQKIVELDSFVKKREENTLIGESGIKISGGEKQKILIARSLFQKPDFLFLDETFSNINKISAENIISNIKKNYPDLLIILISHQNFNIRFKHRAFEIKDKELLEL